VTWHAYAGGNESGDGPTPEDALADLAWKTGDGAKHAKIAKLKCDLAKLEAEVAA
jgi:hypothetical protein